MAEVEQGVFARLSGQAGVTAIVGTKIYPLIAPPDASLPFVVCTKISDIKHHAVSNDISLTVARVQVDSMSTSHAQAISLSHAVRVALQDYAGTTGGVGFQRIFLEDRTNLSEFDIDSGKTTHRISQDFKCWYS
uniref:DUF3168 domain-containing protein n=1 Tax=viral metagenome TaxID=1070528 RepID=A0A6M3KE64_9ZZZZ